MAELPRVGDVEIDQRLGFERAGWRAQRVAWGLLALVLLGALLGLTGTGPLSRATAGSTDGPLRVEYERFIRVDAPAELRIWLAAGVAREGRSSVWIDREYLKRVEVTGVVPEPEAVELAADRVTYVFRVGAGGPAEATLHFQPLQFGLAKGRVGLRDGDGLPVRQFVYP